MKVLFIHYIFRRTDVVTEIPIILAHPIAMNPPPSLLSVITYILRNSEANLFLVMTIIAFIVSDMFYIFIVKVENNWVFKSVNLIAQFLSYYFFVTYSLIKVKEK